MIQEIQINVLQSYVNYLKPQSYTTTGSGLRSLVLPTQFKTQSTMVFINDVYQSFNSYVEGSDNQTLEFNNTISSGQVVTVRYGLLEI